MKDIFVSGVLTIRDYFLWVTHYSTLKNEWDDESKQFDTLKIRYAKLQASVDKPVDDLQKIIEKKDGELENAYRERVLYNTKLSLDRKKKKEQREFRANLIEAMNKGERI